MTAVSSCSRYNCYQQTAKIGRGVAYTVDVITDKIMDPVDYSIKLTGTTRKIIQFVDGAISKIGEGLKNFSRELSGFLGIAEALTCVSLVWGLARGKFKDTLEKIGKVFIAIFAGLLSIKFFESLQLFNLSSVTNAIGSIPVLGLVVQIPVWVFGLLGYSFDTAYRGKLLMKNAQAAKVCKVVSEHWKNKNEFYKDKVEGHTHKLTIERIDALKAADKEIIKLRKELLGGERFKHEDELIKAMREATRISARKFVYHIDPELLASKDVSSINRQLKKQQEHETPQPIFNKDACIKERLTFETKRWKALSDTTKLDAKRTWATIAINITKIVFAVLALAAVAGVAALAFTTPLMLTIGAVFAVLNLAKVFYDIFTKDSIKVPQPSPLLVAMQHARPNMI